ncbi:ubiquitin-protein ligase peroxin 12 [Coemansia aciculifera]|uniref:Ubiquitin-protein ligase peroxin 12 n=1 Tax=Coemansia aciculifera TaxID=417176 RepID=A0ACC1M4Z6_9FUNG|nr:ubiquitin-protein ligase peroxin 12 [Coemansia aciculifera]KAJ2910007.1 ubiquitin-protein ligase peroxin 12 [Coemansia aciculifera]
MEFMSDMLSGADSGKPSLFEIVAQHKMSDLIEPALRHVTSVCAQRYPRQLVRILNWHEEVYAAVMLLVERHYLRAYGGSFAEHFYGTKRVRTRKIRGDNGLTRGDVWGSLALLVGLPLVKTRLDQYYEKVSGGEAARLLGNAFAPAAQSDDESLGTGDSGTSGLHRLVERWRLVLKRLFKVYYPHFNFIYHAATALYYVAYMFDRTNYNSPWLHILGLQVRRLSAADYRAMNERSAATTDLAAPANGSPIRFVRNMVAYMLAGGLDFLKVLLPLSIFFYRFLEWWHRSDFHKRAQMLPPPPPPMPLRPHSDGLAVPEDQALCPVCKEPRTNPAVAPSGYVFCYPCIFNHVSDKGTCPVTLAEAKVGDIRKLFSE